MELDFINASDLERNVKCSIHQNGKLGFSRSAASKLDLLNNESVKIATNREGGDGNLYLIVQEDYTKDAFRISKAGEYYYLSTKPLFDNLGIDYKSVRVIYDIEDFEHNGIKMYKLVKREKPKKQEEE